MNVLERLRQELESFGQIPAMGQARGAACALMTRLFCEVLGWGNPRGSTPRNLQLRAPLSCEVTAVPVAQMSGLPVYCVEWPQDKLPGVTARRAVQRALAPVSTEHLTCYVTQDRRQLAFTRARRRLDGKIELRTLPYEVGSPARTTIERLAELAFSLDELRAGQPPITRLTDKLDRAFDVEAVTRDFFEAYKQIFDDLQKRLYDASSDRGWAHDYALQLLNRILFLYFIQRKRWLGNNPRFLRHFWESYKRSGQLKDSFYERWLKVLFFEAFNNRFHGGYGYFPEDIRSALQMAPFLNGGLFRENQLDTAYEVNVPDEFFVQIFDRFDGSTPGFLERYNFTIAESTPLDVEVAVDPEMIGKVYESLVNITFKGLTEEDLRGSAGIFYTPRVEIDLMCRLALVDVLANHLGTEYKELLYDTVFATDPDETARADAALTKHNLWPRLNEILRSLTICDPACGSGSFLVGMLLVLDDLQERANTQLGIEETPYERRRRIIGEQLYGVDVMDWAVHVAELRLWLQLVVETELKPAELHLRPLLPNLSFKVRQGDSLVQEIANINFGLHRQHLDIPSHLKCKLTQLKGKKLRFYQGEERITEAALKHEELQLFREILQHKIHALQNQITALNRQVASLGSQTELPGMERKDEHRTPTQVQMSLHTQLEEKQAERQRLQDALNALKTVQDVPFVWDIAFVEIFEGDAGGFDIVIGNPPYVRQEKIAPPLLDPKDVGGENWKEQKEAYKKKLQHSVAAAWPRFFQYKPAKGTFRKPDGKSDLYIYFYFHALSLLNPKGSFCFITSNSWLDVGYGADLQEFLLKHSHVKLVLDNEVKRSFAQADVNTVIVLLAPPDDRREWGLDQTARFVMFKKPFEEVVRAEVFKAIEAVTDRESTDTYRATTRPQRELLEEGLETEIDETEATATRARKRKTTGPLIKTARYIGNKWGGKYLRAPDIFFTILEKGKGKLVRLGGIAEVNEGRPTGANDFFYVPKGVARKFGIEPHFLHEGIMKTRGFNLFVIQSEHCDRYFLSVDLPRNELKDTAVIRYIEFGEKQGLHKRNTFSGKLEWYRFKVRQPAELVAPCGLGSTFFCAINEAKAVSSNSYTEIRLRNSAHLLPLWASLNSVLLWLQLELVGRISLGGGMLKIDPIEYRQLLTIDHALLSYYQHQINQTLQVLRKRRVMDVLKEIHQPDRRALDEVVFDVLGLTAGEREAVYEAVVELVRARLEKARSV